MRERQWQELQLPLQPEESDEGGTGSKDASQWLAGLGKSWVWASSLEGGAILTSRTPQPKGRGGPQQEDAQAPHLDPSRGRTVPALRVG